MSSAKVEVYTTEGVAPRERLSYWNRLMRATFDSGAVCASPEARAFSAHMVRAKLADLQFVELCAGSTAVRHADSPGAASRKLFILQLQLEGCSVKRQCGRVAELTAGDFTICDGDSARRFELDSRGFHRQLSIGIPKDLLRRYVGSLESVLAARMCGTRGPSGLASVTMRAFWQRFREDPSSMQGTLLTRALLEMIAAAYAGIPPVRSRGFSSAMDTRSRALAYIEAHLHESELGPRKIADAMGMSSRNLHYLFAEEDESVRRYILRRRLEESARVIATPSLRGRTLTAIAFDLGFDSATHFGRVFRARYGLTPRQYRLRALSTA
jgi:AraC-like DNA-binding protein